MDEEGMEYPTSMVTDADLIICRDLEVVAEIKDRVDSVKNRLDILVVITKERKPWWRL